MAMWRIIDYVTVVEAAISVLVNLVILLSLIYSKQKANPDSMPKAVVLNMTYVTIIAYIISNGTHIIKHIINDDLTLVLSTIITCVIVLSWNISQIFIYILLMFRVHHSFNDTKYAVSKIVYIIFIILMILFGICSLIFMTHEVVLYEYILYRSASWHYTEMDLGATYAIVTEIIDFCISVLLITIFVKKMNQVTIDIHINDQISEFSQQQKLLLDISAKYCILSFVATLWTQLAALLYCIFWFSLYFAKKTDYVSWWNTAIITNDIFEAFVYFDGIINPICLYLLFDINNDKYKRICHGCHSFVRLCFKRFTQKSVKKKYNDGNSLEISLLH
eukprot:32116_1